VPKTRPVLNHERGASECEHREKCEHRESECGTLASEYKGGCVCVGRASERVQVASSSISAARPQCVIGEYKHVVCK